MASDHTKKVWVFDHPGSELGQPKLVGYLTRLSNGNGIFEYDKSYASNNGRALDRCQLRNLRRQVQINAGERRGIPGIIADAGPDAWGEKVLEMDLGYQPNPLEVLAQVRDDGVGNIMVGDLSEARLLPPMTTLDELEAGIQMRLNGIDDPNIQLQKKYLSPDTALGGGKPKASILLNGEMWIAKFPDRGDPADFAFHEAAAMEMMRRIALPTDIFGSNGGITRFDVADTSVHTFSNGKNALLVKRFDRETLDGGIKRFGFASARTVIGMLDSEISASYHGFAKAAEQWVPADKYSQLRIKIWLRLAYNALIGNMDDHPRNHALLQAPDMTWDLSPAYDVLPKTNSALKLALSMTFYAIKGIPGQVSKSGAVTAEGLLRSCMDFGITPAAAKTALLIMAEQIEQHWAQVLDDIKAPRVTADFTQHTIDWVGFLKRQLADFQIPLAWEKVRQTRSWNWQP